MRETPYGSTREQEQDLNALRDFGALPATAGNLKSKLGKMHTVSSSQGRGKKKKEEEE